jgi:chaperonin GroEL
LHHGKEALPLILTLSKKIVDNAGGEGAVVAGRLLESFNPESKESFNYGFNAATGEYCDLVKAGVIDPVKVVRTALVDASGVASLLTTTECMIVDAPKKESASGGMPGGMGGTKFS